jgi:hypothetical protein
MREETANRNMCLSIRLVPASKSVRLPGGYD